MDNRPVIDWPRPDYSCVPNSVYHDPALYALEQERIFRGPVWQFLGLDAEIPEPGDFRTSYLGDTPVVCNRGHDGRAYAFINRCAHRSAMVRREVSGNAQDHTCIYHRWCYDLEGNLIGIPFRNGIAGNGGLPEEFDPAQHGLRKLRVESFHGVLFATFSEQTEPLIDYLGPAIAKQLARTMRAPLRILGYQRQCIAGNWKLYAENTRDQYHGSLLHEFQGTFLSRITTPGGSAMDPRHRHNIVYSLPWKEMEAAKRQSYDKADVLPSRRELLDPSFLEVRQEFADGYGSTICAVFPNATFQQIRNSLATRQLRTKGIGAFELFWTIYGYQDDDEDMTRHRLRQANLGGPGGYVSLEDGEAIEITHRATMPATESHSILEMGGAGAFPEEVTSRINDIAVRGFWSYYSELMGLEPEGAVR